MTEFSVEVQRQPVTHRLRFKQVTSWAESGGKSPQDTMARNRIRGMLNADGKGRAGSVSFTVHAEVTGHSGKRCDV